MKEWTHKMLVRRIATWLKWTKQNTVVMSELATRNGETPDVIGWIGGASSTLIECKVSRADFLADSKKWFRRDEERGMGDVRYIATPEGLLQTDEIPAGWGLLEAGARCVREIRKPEQKQGSKRNECVMLMSALRRLEISTAVFVRQEETQPAAGRERGEGEDGNNIH